MMILLFIRGWWRLSARTWEQLVVVGDAEEQAQVVAHVAPLRIHQDVPAAVTGGGRNVRLSALSDAAAEGKKNTKVKRCFGEMCC